MMLFFNRKRRGEKKKSRKKTKGFVDEEGTIREQKEAEERRQKTLDVDDDTEEQIPVECEPESEPALIVISGAGIVGLVLALALKKPTIPAPDITINAGSDSGDRKSVV